MSYINKTRLRPDKLYKASQILIKIPKGTKRAHVLMPSSGSVQDLLNLHKRLKFAPNTSRKMYIPGFDINPINLQSRNKTSIRNTKYADLSKAKMRYNKILNLDKIPPEYYSSPVVFDFSVYRSTFNAYVARTRKNPATAGVYFVKLMDRFLTSLPSGVSLETYIDIKSGGDSFTSQILYMIQRKPTEIFKILNRLGAIFYTENGYIFRGNFSDVSQKPKVLLNVRKLLRVSTGNIEASDSDIEEVTEEEVSKSDKELYDETEKEVDDGLGDVEDEPEAVELETEDDIEPDTEFPGETEGELDPAKMEPDNILELPPEEDDTELFDDPLYDNSPKKTTIEPTEPELEIPFEEEEVLNIDELRDVSLMEDEIKRLQKENEQFVTSNIAIQEKALKFFEEEADKASVNKDLDVLEIPDANIISDSMRNISLNSITTSYYEKQYKRDVLDSVKSLNKDPEYPLIVTSMEVKDNSTALAKLDELTVEFKDKKNKRHKFSIDVPRLSHDGFMMFGGNKKFIAKQTTPSPVIKEAVDRVQITTNYRKTFLYRKGDKISGQIDRILRLLKTSFKEIEVKYGNSTTVNSEMDVSVAYNYLAKSYYRVLFTLEQTSVSLWLNQPNLREYITELHNQKKVASLPDYEQYVPVGFIEKGKDKTHILLEEISTRKIFRQGVTSKELVPHSESLTQFLTTVVEQVPNKELAETYSKLKLSKSLSYTEIKIASTSVTLGSLIAMYKGLLKALDAYEIIYRVEEKRVAPSNSEVVLRFKDIFLYIDTEFKPHKELFVNGLTPLDTESYTLDSTGPYANIYLDYIEKYTPSRNNAKALMNFESSMIDVITLENLKNLGLPTTFPELLLYGNTLLGDYSRHRKNDVDHYRIRDSEVITVAVYSALMEAYNNYKRYARSGTHAPMSVRKDAVLRNLQGMTNVEDYSTLNPFLEAELKSKATFKGPSGLNSSDAFTAEMRSYDPSMLGLFGIYTPIGPEVGINRSLVMNPKIQGIRGEVKPFDLEKADATQLFSIGELLNVFTAKHADSPRAVMATVQGKHLTPTKVQHPYIVGNGSDKALAHIIGQDFTYSAQDNGVVKKIDKKNQLCIIEYADKSTSMIDLTTRPAKNSGGGFFIENRLELIDKIKVGYKFKKGEILAYDDNFFKPTLDGSISFAGGCMTKIAIMPQAETFEDSAVITQRMVDDMSSEVINDRKIALDKTTRIISMAKIGDKIDVNDPLVIFESIGNDEEMTLKALEKLDDSTRSTIETFARSTAKAKYSGEIVDIKIFYNAELDDLHPSLRNVVEGYVRTNNSKANIISKMRSNEFIVTPSTKKIDSDKIMGGIIDGVLIQFFIKHLDKFGVGDKCSFSVAIKAIVAETIPEGLEPYSEYNKDEEISAFVSPMSIVSRMVPDVYLIGYSTKVVMELEKECIRLLES